VIDVVHDTPLRRLEDFEQVFQRAQKPSP